MIICIGQDHVAKPDKTRDKMGGPREIKTFSKELVYARWIYSWKMQFVRVNPNLIEIFSRKKSYLNLRM